MEGYEFMDAINVVLLVMRITFPIITMVLLGWAIYCYIATRKFNRNGIVTYGKIVGREYRDASTTDGLTADELYIKFDLENQEYTSMIPFGLPSMKTLDKKYAMGSKKKIIALKTNRKSEYLIYDVKLLKENKEKLTYLQTIIYGIFATITFAISFYFWFKFF